MLGALIAGGISAAAGAASGIAPTLANNQLQKRNREKLDELLAREKQGLLGLTPAQQRILDQRLQAPIAAAANEARTRAEQIQAAGGVTSGADLSRLRTEQSRQLAGGAQAAAMQVAQADQAAKAAQLDEIEQRDRLKAQMKADDYAQILGAVSETAGATGLLAGSPPGTFQLTELFGSKFSDDERRALADYAKANPGKFEEYMKQLLQQQSGVPGGTTLQATGGPAAPNSNVV
jgi:hypothetical protein